VKKYKKKTKPKSRAALLRENKKLETHSAELMTKLCNERHAHLVSRNTRDDQIRKLTWRVKELETRLDGIFKPVAETRFTVGAFMDCPVNSYSVFTDGTVGLSTRTCVDEFRMIDSYDKRHLKNHIKDMLTRQMNEKLEEALKVL